MNNGTSLQEMNDPDRFQYGNPDAIGGGLFRPGFGNDSGYNDPNGEEFNFDNQHTPRNQAPNLGLKKEMSQSPNKTGGTIQLKDLANDDVTNEPYIGRDAVVIIEGEMRQFDGKRVDKIQRYVESLVTGNFMEVKKEINLQIQQDGLDEKARKLQSNREQQEREMREIQRIWVNRVNKNFLMFLGLLAGMSLMHLIVILSQGDKSSFLQLYSKVSTMINVVFMVFTSFCLILGLSLTMIYKQKSDEKMRNMDEFRLEFRQHYIVSTIMTCIVGFCLLLIYILPVFTNKIYYKNPDSIKDSDIMGVKGLFGAVNVLFIITWLMASAFNKASISDLDLDPEDHEQIELADNTTVGDE